MIEFVLLGAGWLLLSLPVSVLLGRCIAVGQAGETARHAAAAATAGEAVDGPPGPRAPSGAALPALPAQRQPVASEHLVR